MERTTRLGFRRRRWTLYRRGKNSNESMASKIACAIELAFCGEILFDIFVDGDKVAGGSRFDDDVVTLGH